MTLVIDAGHGGADGGTISVDGIRESDLNLEIALRAEALAALAGIKTVMIRREDTSVETDGDTIAKRKVSDLKQRVHTVNAAENPVLLSIHQNHFSEPKYHGAQVFYAPSAGSEALAKQMQNALREAIDPKNRRECKKADSVYLLSNVTCPAVLVECGFLSNAGERQLLQTANYQIKLAMTMVSVLSQAEGNGCYEI